MADLQHNQPPQMPDGMLQDAKGRWVPKRLIKPVDLERDKLVLDLVGRAKDLSASLAGFKSGVMGDVQAFVDLSAEEYGVSHRGVKGNVTLHSFDGRYKVVRSIADTLTFDERLMAAKQLIDECVREWSQNAGVEIRALVEHAFQADSAGKVSTERVLGLRKLNIEHAKWTQAMRAISDSVHMTSSKTYMRFYERVAEQWVPISLDLATVGEQTKSPEAKP
jgi:hypothetical protein